jgi:hypothetical protein
VLRLALPRWQAVAAAPASLIPAAAARYARHAPERTRLYALVQAHYPEFIARHRLRPRPRNRTIGHAHTNCENQYRA